MMGAWRPNLDNLRSQLEALRDYIFATGVPQNLFSSQ